MVRLILYMCALITASPCLGFRVVHYNIRELDSVKIAAARKGREPTQLDLAVEILATLRPDILSLNELQYDLPGVPDGRFTSKGENAAAIAALLGWKNPFITFDPANTGRDAKRLSNGSYATDPNHPEWRSLVDHVNFGIFPAQYSTAGISRFAIEKSLVLDSLPWKRFTPRDLSPYRDAIDRPYPETMELFDKNFTDVTLRAGERRFHLILLHAVPAHEFDNPRGLNVVRNADQLAFLEWYLTGESAGTVIAEEVGIEPLAPDTPFIAIGDWNVDLAETAKPGSRIVARLHERFSPAFAPQLTYESGFGAKPFQRQFDYLLASRHFVVRDGGVHRPAPNREELGCEAPPATVPEGRALVRWEEGGKTCFALVDESHHRARLASDHYAIWGDLGWRDDEESK